MITYKIYHKLHYKFEKKVKLSPQELRLKFREFPYSHLDSFIIDIHPKPKGIKEFLDVENNFLMLIWFEEATKELKIMAESVVGVQERDRFDFIIYPGSFNNFEIIYPESLKEAISMYVSNYDNEISILDYTMDIKSKAESTLDFILKLTWAISQDFEQYIRPEGDAMKPLDTFNARKGSCRDFATLLINMFRQIGLAARFVSGYQYIENAEEGNELHAWVEVFLPGVGWFGVDPTSGLAVNQNYIPINASVSALNTQPLTGGYSGDAKSTLETKVKIDRYILS